MRSLFKRLTALSAGLLYFAVGAAIAQDARLGPQEGVLLLRNGEVLQGKITLAGDRYYVVLPAGEIFPKVSEVEMFCRDLNEGYLFRRQRVRPDRVEDRLDLAEWCIRHRLLDQAAAELQDAATTDHTHPMIPLLQRRLELAKNPPPAPEASRAAIVSHDELDRLVRGLPPASVETFTTSIQPLLINHCATAGCHGPQSQTTWQLLRVPLAKSATRRVTQRNIASTLDLVKRDSPSASRLLTAPLEQHGTTRGPIFSSREIAQYKLLVDWVYQVANGTKAPPPASVQPESPPLLQTIQPAEPHPAKTASATAGRDVPASLKLRDDASAGTNAGGQTRPDSPVYVPVDPFDAEVFNRRYFPPK
ncbi:MAG: hypothetical protein HY000_05140 [Planctomycetes bacterium]|nr:hypothetical protein [Planctomycetota bacterium]